MSQKYFTVYVSTSYNGQIDENKKVKKNVKSKLLSADFLRDSGNRLHPLKDTTGKMERKQK